MDFTIKRYITLLDSLNHNRNFQSFRDFINNPIDKSIVLRHDVDLLPKNSLRFAKIQNELGIKGSYYFRAVPESWNEDIIKEIADLGHEIGYHYENMDTAYQKIKGKNDVLSLSKGKKEKVEQITPFYDKIVDIAYEDFCMNIERLRKLVPVSTICMHGSPRSKFDNKSIWNKYDYKKLGIIGEPYFDVDFNQVFYLTDTGRRWDGWKTSVRDKVPQQEEWIKKGLVFHSTDDIIVAINKNRLPNQIIFTMHPQRWSERNLFWIKEFVLQNAKNQVKKIIITRK